MERIDISDGRRVADLVDAVERGGEVVIVRDGVVVAAVVVPATPGAAPVEAEQMRPGMIDLDAIRDLHVRFPGLRIDSAAKLVRNMRDEDDR